MWCIYLPSWKIIRFAGKKEYEEFKYGIVCWLVSYVHESNGLCKGQTDTTGFMTQRNVSSLCEHFRQIHVIFVVLRDIVDTSCWQCSFAASTTVWIPSEVEMSCRRTRQVFSFH